MEVSASSISSSPLNERRQSNHACIICILFVLLSLVKNVTLDGFVIIDSPDFFSKQWQNQQHTIIIMQEAYLKTSWHSLHFGKIDAIMFQPWFTIMILHESHQSLRYTVVYCSHSALWSGFVVRVALACIHHIILELLVIFHIWIP